MSLEALVADKMILYFNHDVRRINHALKVYGLTKTLAALEKVTLEQEETAVFAAILHDIGIKECERKYNSTAGSYQELEGPPLARQMLEELGVAQQLTERILYIIGNHHSYDRIDGVDFQILVEADFLVNIFEDGLTKEAAGKLKQKYFKTEHGKRFFDAMFSHADAAE